MSYHGNHQQLQPGAFAFKPAIPALAGIAEIKVYSV
jgi:hypothetical protein